LVSRCEFANEYANVANKYERQKKGGDVETGMEVVNSCGFWKYL